MEREGCVTDSAGSIEEEEREKKKKKFCNLLAGTEEE